MEKQPPPVRIIVPELAILELRINLMLLFSGVALGIVRATNKKNDAARATSLGLTSVPLERTVKS